MTQVHNHTPFHAHLSPLVDDAGQRKQLLVVKGLWSLVHGGLADQTSGAAQHNARVQESPVMVRVRSLALSPGQREALGDRCDDEIEWQPADVVPPKPQFDLIICGYAHSQAPVQRFFAEVRFREHRADLALHAPRYWQATLLSGGGAIPGPYLEAVRQVPLHPAFAFGGLADNRSLTDNPIGMGHPRNAPSLAQIPLPWVEHPAHSAKAALPLPHASAFGPWPASAKHRRIHTGTHDERWLRERHPLPPADFHPRYHNQADPRLQWPEAPQAGEHIELHQLSPRANCRTLVWPKLRLHTRWGTQAQPAHRTLQPDTCLVHTEEDTYAIVWRTLLPPDVSPQLHIL